MHVLKCGITVVMSKYTRDAANEARQLTGQTLTGFIDQAVWARIDFVKQRFHKANVRRISALRRAVKFGEIKQAEKTARAVDDQSALFGTGIEKS
jgi:hypothetical protein